MNWGWRIFLLYALFVLMTLSMVWYMSRQQVNLVSRDYYRQEIGYQDQIDKMNKVQALGQPPAVEYAPETGYVVVRFPSGHSGSALRGSITMFRPSDSRMDVRLPVQPDTTGVQVIPVTNLAAGLWRVQLDWQKGGEAYYFEQKVMIE
jgi:hypothetical protein